MDEFLAQIDKHRDQFYRFVLRTVWDSNVANDVFSSAVLAAYDNRHKFTPGTNFRAWMFRILTNKCFVANRETMRAFEPLDDARVGMVALHEQPEYGDVLADPEPFLEECGNEVFRALRCLSTAERACILLRAAERFSYKEIASILEMPVGTVMTHLSRGRAKLRRELLEFAIQSGVVRKRPKLVPKESNTASRRGGEANQNIL